jgi:hypothetical protein
VTVEVVRCHSVDIKLDGFRLEAGQALKALQCVESKIYTPVSSSKNRRLPQGAFRK